MTRNRWAMAMLVVGVMYAPASAQFFPPPVVGMPVVLPNGIDFQYKRGGLRINGFIPTGGPPAAAVLPVVPGFAGPGAFIPATYYPYAYPYYPHGYPFPAMGAVDQRITVTVTQPAVLVQRRGLAPFMEDYDLSGIDLDVEPASKIWGKKPALLGQAERKEPAREEFARVMPPAEKKLQAAANQVNLPKPPAVVRKVAVAPDGAKLVDLGSKAFRDGEFALALRHFRDAGDMQPNLARAWFLQAHAAIAMGQLHTAVEQIETGLKRNPHFHLNGFRPKTELFADKLPMWNEHLELLKKVQQKNPKNADALFLLGYLAWYDGEREAAVGFFQQARPLIGEPRFVDLFLNSPAAKQ